MRDGENAALARAEARIAELEAMVAALRRQLADKAESLPNLLPKFYRRDEIPVFDGREEPPVDLVLTVKNTYEFLAPCLESLFRNTDVPFRLFLNDNASDDSRTPELLRKIRDDHPDQVRLFLQTTDLGFPDAVNLMLAETANDVVIVNADTVLPPRWASRLLWPMRHSGKKTASCTPATNAGPLVAFPEINADSELFEGLELERLDAVFQAVKPEGYWTMPAGYGFCMAMSRAALDETGLFDAETFRPGYGEETDWCRRAAARGFVNLFAPNLFVYHKHGATMRREAPQSRDALRRRNEKIVAVRYPDLEDKAFAFMDDPAYRAFRSFLLFMLSAEAGGGFDVAVTNHARLAGPELRRPDAFPPDRPLALVARHPGTGEYFLRFGYRGHGGRFSSPDYNWLVKTLHRVHVSRILIEDAPPGPDADKLRRALRRLGERAGAPVTLWNGDPVGADSDRT